MCSYCGCQSITVIGLLTTQHEEIINKLGLVRRAAEGGDIPLTQSLALELTSLLNPHVVLEENGLFAALMSVDEFVEPLAKLTFEHREIDELVERLVNGDLSDIDNLDTLLRNHISNEENGIFPAAAVTLDGNVWDQMEKDQGIVNEAAS